MELNEFLVFLFAGGGNVIIGSWILERISWFQSLDSEKKQYVFYVVGAVLAFAAYSVITFVPAETIEQISPFFFVLYTIFGGLISGDVFHKYTKRDVGAG